MSKRIALFAFAVMLGLLSSRTFHRNAEWADEGSFLASNLVLFPYDARLWTMIGNYDARTTNVLIAINNYDMARHYEGRTNNYYRQQTMQLTAASLASLNLAVGRVEIAKTEAQRAIAAFPDDAKGWHLLTLIYLRTGEFRRARITAAKWALREPGTESLKLLQFAALNNGELELAGRIGAVLAMPEELPLTETAIPHRYTATVLFLLVAGLFVLAYWMVFGKSEADRVA